MKAYAKIVVKQVIWTDALWYREPKPKMIWQVALESDMEDLSASVMRDEYRSALRVARAWSRRLGNIPVEVQE